jgi:hypothetical protein
VAEYGELHVLVWDGHALSARLESAAVAVHRLPKPTTNGPTPTPLALDTSTAAPLARPGSPAARRAAGHAVTAVLTGVGIALGHRLVDALHPTRRRT